MDQELVFICLHGCNQTADAFRSYMKNLERILKPLKAKFVYHEAVYDHPLGGKTWYETPLNVADIGHIQYSPELVGNTLTELQAVVKQYENARICLLGFSQGGNVVDTYLQHEYNRHYPELGPVKLAVIISGYSLLSDPLPKVRVPLINVTGAADIVVPPHLAPKNYESYRLLPHPDGHIIPKSETSRALLKSITETL